MSRGLPNAGVGGSGVAAGEKVFKQGCAVPDPESCSTRENKQAPLERTREKSCCRVSTKETR